jgi:signal transduction histidine kinase
VGSADLRSEDAETQEHRQLRLNRILLACGGVAYLGWWSFVHFALPGAFNPFPGRAAVVACFVLAVAASYLWKGVADRLADVLALCCGIATVHYFYLLDRNQADLEWVVGSYITITAICAILQTARSLLYYSIFVAIASVVLLMLEPMLSFVVFMPGTLTILLFANVGLRSRLALVAELQESLAARKRAEAALVLANHELESFSYSVAHDLRAPLRGIDGFSQILMEDCADALDATGRGYLQKVRSEAQRMGELIDDLLELARVSRAELSRQRLDVSRLASDVVEQLRSHDPQRTVTCAIQSGIVVDADRRLVHILLENLIGNAWKFTAKTPEAKIEVAVETGSEGPVLSIRDNGAGFDMAFSNKLFAPFQRLHGADEFPGTGIGLATVHRIVQRHGGRVWAESTVGQGATFRLTLSSHRSAAALG